MAVLFFLFGMIGGVFGGLGMGGGTFLIPLLTIFGGVSQHVSQAVNLIAFLPMSVIALFIHIKNGFVDTKTAAIFILPALLFAFLFSFVAQYVDGVLLKKIFGAFLVFLSALFFVKDKRKDKLL